MTSGLTKYIRYKRKRLDEQAKQPGGPSRLEARAVAEGRAGVRRIFIREYQVISDGRQAGGGFDLGPAPGELLLGSLAACLNHGFLIQAALLDLELDAVEVEVEASIAPGVIGVASAEPVELGLAYTAKIISQASDEQLEYLRKRVELNSFVFNVVTRGSSVAGRIERTAA
ncbi:OsmC family protein [Mesorhizobium sp. DCY119]|uniref:OsmC family protein n=1 Tax=Mesorhizobium sp. DCY119 TaxID=2108445 RepID=UPI000E71855C|nr:OsmC family protein [Mesorhizobium sp. DCY119]RJG40608.1 OsmC family peroxiredoxin [Mesorhizobium sp. DCY119]